MTNEETAALNSQMDDESICPECAEMKGGKIPDGPSAITFWIGTCMVCRKAKDCCSVRDYRWLGGVRPKREG